MTRKLRRTKAFDLTLEVKDDAFIRPPREAQRNWLLNRAVRELADDLHALDGLAAEMVVGVERSALDDKSHGNLSDHEIMEDWQVPLMRAMAEVAAGKDRDLLEIGFGRGVASTFLQEIGVRSHTIVECNQALEPRFLDWKQSWPDRDIRWVPGMWQDVVDDLGKFDAVFFHTYALNEDEAAEYLADLTFAAHFFPTAARLLREGGRFTYMTNEIDSLSRSHQRLLFEHFRAFRLRVVPLDLPADLEDAWWSPSMAVIEVEK